jgi:hypothetical protein
MKDEARQVVVNAQKAVESAEFSDTKKTAKTVNGLFTTYGTLMQPLFKEFADAQRAVAGAILDVIENGIGILREDAGFDRAKLDKLRIKLQESRVQWAGIKTTGEQMGETIKSGFSSAFGGGDGTGAPIETDKHRILVSCVSFDGGKKLVTWGVDELFKIEKFLFSFLGAGKAMFSTQKRELSGAAIQKIEEGIAALKKLGYDARKIAGYEANLAKFRKERDNIKKTKQEERIDSVRGGLGDIVKGAGGLFGKK